MSMGRCIQLIRRDAGLSQYTLARVAREEYGLKLTQSQVAKIEAGNVDVSPATAGLIVSAIIKAFCREVEARRQSLVEHIVVEEQELISA